MVMQEMGVGAPIQTPEVAPNENEPEKRQAVFDACQEIHNLVSQTITDIDLREHSNYMGKLDIMIDDWLYQLPADEKRGVLKGIVQIGDEIVGKLLAGEIELRFTKPDALERRKEQVTVLKEKVDFVRDNIAIFPQGELAKNERLVD